MDWSVEEYIRYSCADDRDATIFLCWHCNNLCESVHPFEDTAIGVRDEMDVKDVHISNYIHLDIEGSYCEDHRLLWWEEVGQYITILCLCENFLYISTEKRGAIGAPS